MGLIKTVEQDVERFARTVGKSAKLMWNVGKVAVEHEFTGDDIKKVLNKKSGKKVSVKSKSYPRTASLGSPKILKKANNSSDKRGNVSVAAEPRYARKSS